MFNQGTLDQFSILDIFSNTCTCFKACFKHDTSLSTSSIFVLVSGNQIQGSRRLFTINRLISDDLYLHLVYSRFTSMVMRQFRAVSVRPPYGYLVMLRSVALFKSYFLSHEMVEPLGDVGWGNLKHFHWNCPSQRQLLAYLLPNRTQHSWATDSRYHYPFLSELSKF